MAVTFIKAVMFIRGVVISIEGAIIFIEEAVISIEGAVIFIDKRGLVIGGLFKIAKIGTRVVDAVKGVDKYNLKRRLIIYKLKDPLLLIYS